MKDSAMSLRDLILQKMVARLVTETFHIMVSIAKKSRVIISEMSVEVLKVMEVVSVITYCTLSIYSSSNHYTSSSGLIAHSIAH